MMEWIGVFFMAHMMFMFWHRVWWCSSTNNVVSLDVTWHILVLCDVAHGSANKPNSHNKIEQSLQTYRCTENTHTLIITCLRNVHGDMIKLFDMFKNCLPPYPYMTLHRGTFPHVTFNYMSLSSCAHTHANLDTQWYTYKKTSMHYATLLSMRRSIHPSTQKIHPPFHSCCRWHLRMMERPAASSCSNGSAIILLFAVCIIWIITSPCLGMVPSAVEFQALSGPMTVFYGSK